MDAEYTAPNNVVTDDLWSKVWPQQHIFSSSKVLKIYNHRSFVTAQNVKSWWGSALKYLKSLTIMLVERL